MNTLQSLTSSDPDFPQMWNLSVQHWPANPQVLEFHCSIKDLWRFPVLPSPQDLSRRVEALLGLARQMQAKNALVAGPVFLATPLALELELSGIQVWHPFGKKLPGGGHELLGVIPALSLTEPIQ